MPYKDKEKQNEANRNRMQRVRQGNTKNGNTEKVTQETVPASYVQGVTGKFLSLPERPRYLTLPDGQVLDRLNQPEGKIKPYEALAMLYCNESSYNFHPNRPSKEMIKVLEKL